MSRSVVGYIPSGFLNSAASTSPFGSVDAETGAPIATGLVVGTFQEFSDAEAKSYSQPIAGSYLYQLYGGTYMWVQLDPAVVGTAVAVGTALWWLQTNTGYVVTTTQSANAPDYAGVSIDPNFGLVNNYAFIQINGKCTIQYRAATTKGSSSAFGDSIFLYVGGSTVDLGAFDDMGTAAVSSGGLVSGSVNINLFAGIALAVTAQGAAGLARITRSVSRF